MAKNGKSQFAILGMLAVLKKSTGYDVKKHMEASTQYFWKETFSSIYPVLEDLEQQKLIVEVDKNKQGNDRQRNVYALTAKGRGVLEHWLLQQPEAMQLRNELMLKLFFGNMVPVQVSIGHLEEHKKELKNKLAMYKDIHHALSQEKSSESLFSLITLDHGIRVISASLAWCDSAIRTLRSAKN